MRTNGHNEHKGMRRVPRYPKERRRLSDRSWYWIAVVFGAVSLTAAGVVFLTAVGVVFVDKVLPRHETQAPVPHLEPSITDMNNALVDVLKRVIEDVQAAGDARATKCFATILEQVLEWERTHRAIDAEGERRMDEACAAVIPPVVAPEQQPAQEKVEAESAPAVPEQPTAPPAQPEPPVVVVIVPALSTADVMNRREGWCMRYYYMQRGCYHEWHSAWGSRVSRRGW